MVRKLVFLAGIAMAATSGAALAQTSATKDTSASVKIVQPISITENKALAFGTIVRPASGSSVITMTSASDTPEITSGSAVLAGGGAARSRAAYTVTGEAGQTYSISLQQASITLTGPTPITLNLTRSKNTGTLTGGTDTFYVGGNMTIANTTTSGDYTGTFNVDIAYN